MNNENRLRIKHQDCLLLIFICAAFSTGPYLWFSELLVAESAPDMSLSGVSLNSKYVIYQILPRGYDFPPPPGMPEPDSFSVSTHAGIWFKLPKPAASPRELPAGEELGEHDWLKIDTSMVLPVIDFHEEDEILDYDAMWHWSDALILEEDEAESFGLFCSCGMYDDDDYGLFQEDKSVIASLEPQVSFCSFPDLEPAPLNLNEVKRLIHYPLGQRCTPLEGTILTRVLVGKKRQYLKHEILESFHPSVSKAVEKRLPRLKFTPGIQGGRPINSWIKIPFSFVVLD